MAMAFWVGTDLNQFIFDSLSVTTVTGFVATCLGLLSISILNEYARIKLLTVKLSRKTTKMESRRESSPLLNRKTDRMFVFLSKCTLWFTLQECLVYLLMVCIMTYNVYILASIVTGAGIGYLIFWPHMYVLSNPQLQYKISETAENSSDEPECSTKVMNNVAKDLIDSLSDDSFESQSEDQIIVIESREALTTEGVSSTSLLDNPFEEAQTPLGISPGQSKSLQLI